MKLKKLTYFSFFIFFIAYAIYQLGIPSITNWILPNQFFLQSEVGRLFFQKTEGNLYCSTQQCGKVTNRTQTGFDFTKEQNIITRFFKHPNKRDTYVNQYIEEINIPSQLFTFNLKKDNHILNISVKQDGSCYHQDTKMPFSFLIGSTHILNHLEENQKYSFGDIKQLILKNNDNSLFALKKQKDDVYQIVTPPPPPTYFKKA